MNQFAMYALTKEAGELEAREWFKSYLQGKRKEEIYANFNEALMLVPAKRMTITLLFFSTIE